MKKRSKIVIIGGGIVGCCISYHLAKNGETDVTLVEKHDLTSGSTCHAAGMVTQFHTNLTMMRMRQYSVELYKSFHAEDGEESGWRQTGSIRMASSIDQLISLKQAVSKARGIGLDIEVLSPEETQKLWPQISLDKVTGSIYLPMDGWVDPHAVTTYMASKAGKMGVTFSTNTLVQDIELTDRGAIQAVLTDKGRIECEIVVNAAGMWAERVAEMAGSFLPIDLVICLMSGGVSSLCCQPVKDLTFDDKREISRLMVNSGADIDEIMTVRGWLSEIKHGRLAHVIHPATMISLTVSDAIGDPMNLNTDWTSMNRSTHKDAVAIMKKYDIWNKVPNAVQSYFTAMETKQVAPHRSKSFNIHNIMIVKTTDLTVSAEAYAQKLGLNTLVLTSMLSGESREAGRFFTSIAKEIHLSNRPAATPCALIATGETAVRIENEDVGKGGRNQEFAVGTCLDLTQTDPIAVCSLGTDGTDGPTHIAGALIDGTTVIRAGEVGMDIHEKLKKHDVLPLLSGTHDAIETVDTETNVCDIAVAVIL